MATTKKGIYYPTDYTKPADVPADMKKLAESVDEAIGNIPQYDDTGIKKDISDLKKEQSTQNKQISDNTKKNTQQDTEISKLQTRVQQLQANMINETTDEATSLHVTNAAELPARLEVRGNHKQDGTPTIETPVEIQAVGDNINYFNKDSATQGKYLNYQNQEIENPAWTYSDYIPCKPNENWIISGYSIIGGAPARCFYDKNKSFLSGGAHNNQETMMKFTTPDNCYFFRESIAKADIDTVKIEKGDIATAYSPYNQGSIEIKKINKNWFNVPSSNSYGVDFALQDDGSYKINGTSTTAWVYRYGSYIWLAKGKYTISAEGIEGLASCIFGVRNDDGSFVKQITPASLTLTFEVLEDIKVRPYFTCSASAVYNNNNVKVMLEKSEAKTEWAKHEEESYVLDIQKPMLQGDYFVKETDGWKEVHTWIERTFTGGFGMRYGTSVFNLIGNGVVNQATSNRKALCTMFKFDTRTYDMSNMATGHFAMQPANNSLFFKDTNYTTADEFNSKLAELNSAGNPLTVFYKTQTPTKLPCTEAQSEVLDQLRKLELFKGTNNIITADDLALLQMTYTVDTKAYIDSKLGSEG